MMTIELRAVDELILELCSPHAAESTALDVAIAYHMRAGGGRVRAAICLDAALRLGVETTDAIRLAAICELLHNASLIQDDMLDRSTTRRGSRSVWCEYSDTVAVCAGDLMLSNAYAAVQGLSSHSDRSALASLIHRRICEVIRGQVQEQQAMPYNEDAQAEYESRARGKSASLLSLALELPLLYAGYADLLGVTHAFVSDFATAYQIADDLLDVEADACEGLLNVVLVIEKAASVGRQLAMAQAAQRGLALLAQAVQGAQQLPENCADLLIRHAMKLRTAMEVQCVAPVGAL
jgi:geranylgeranyl diphosphate synthase type II